MHTDNYDDQLSHQNTTGEPASSAASASASAGRYPVLTTSPSFSAAARDQQSLYRPFAFEYDRIRMDKPVFQDADVKVTTLCRGVSKSTSSPTGGSASRQKSQTTHHASTKSSPCSRSSPVLSSAPPGAGLGLPNTRSANALATMLREKRSQRGRKSDPRMDKALVAKLSNPNLTLKQALEAGGFVFAPKFRANVPDDSLQFDASTLVDADGISLVMRKNNLCGRVRRAKRLLRQDGGDGRRRSSSGSTPSTAPKSPSPFNASFSDDDSTATCNDRTIATTDTTTTQLTQPRKATSLPTSPTHRPFEDTCTFSSSAGDPSTSQMFYPSASLPPPYSINAYATSTSTTASAMSSNSSSHQQQQQLLHRQMQTVQQYLKQRQEEQRPSSSSYLVSTTYSTSVMAPLGPAAAASMPMQPLPAPSLPIPQALHHRHQNRLLQPNITAASTPSEPLVRRDSFDEAIMDIPLLSSMQEGDIGGNSHNNLNNHSFAEINNSNNIASDYINEKKLKRINDSFSDATAAAAPAPTTLTNVKTPVFETRRHSAPPCVVHVSDDMSRKTAPTATSFGNHPLSFPPPATTAELSRMLSIWSSYNHQQQPPQEDEEDDEDEKSRFFEQLTLYLDKSM